LFRRGHSSIHRRTSQEEAAWSRCRGDWTRTEGLEPGWWRIQNSKISNHSFLSYRVCAVKCAPDSIAVAPPSVVDEASYFPAANVSDLGIHGVFCWGNGLQMDSWWRWSTSIGIGNGNRNGFEIESECDSWSMMVAVDHRDWCSIQKSWNLICGALPVSAEGLYPRGRTQILAECACARIESMAAVGHWRGRAQSESVRIVVRVFVVCGVGYFPS